MYTNSRLYKGKSESGKVNDEFLSFQTQLLDASISNIFPKQMNQILNHPLVVFFSFLIGKTKHGKTSYVIDQWDKR